MNVPTIFDNAGATVRNDPISVCKHVHRDLQENGKAVAYADPRDAQPTECCGGVRLDCVVCIGERPLDTTCALCGAAAGNAAITQTRHLSLLMPDPAVFNLDVTFELPVCEACGETEGAQP